MIDLTTFFAHDQHTSIYRPGICTEAATCVLYWMQRAQRGRDNSALNAAIALGNELNLPVLTIFVVADYPAANLRHYHFMLEGLANAAQHLEERGIPFVMRRGAPPQEVARLAQEVHAAALISDESELRTPRAWRAELKDLLTVPFACVDADVVVPSKFFPREEWAARTFRPKIQRFLPAYLQPLTDLEPLHKLSSVPCDPGFAAHPLDYLEQLQIDRSVAPSPIYHGGQDEGKQRLRRFIEARLSSYSQLRNQPTAAATSELSAYLHFGNISVQQTAWEIEQLMPASTSSAQIDENDGRAAYLEELIVRRELAVNFALHNPHYDTLAGCPDWGRATLQKHAQDPREWTYTREELEQARTHDELWNASQREMVTTGRMHGYMRMYWAKKILEWTASPEEAFEDAVYLNDKYEIDGRDANGYTGISWAIGGRHDRPWAPERPIFGLVRYMALSGMQRKMDVRAYIHKWNTLQKV